MKRFAIAISSLWITAVSAQAEYHKGNHSIQFHLGPSGYSHDVRVNNGADILRKRGAAGGLQYLYFIRNSPTLAIGPDILWSHESERGASEQLGNSDSHGAEHLAIYQMLMKLAYPSGHVRPYVIGGMGASRASLKGDITPGAGVTWSDTGTSESRQTFDSVRVGFAGTMGIGLDWFPRKHWFLGLEARYVALSRLEHKPTVAGERLGIRPVRDAEGLSSILLRVGYKFGA
jgi:opacity protein-like surface antigen